MPEEAAPIPPGSPDVALGFDAVWGFAPADQTSPALAAAAMVAWQRALHAAAGYAAAALIVASPAGHPAAPGRMPPPRPGRMLWWLRTP